MSEENYNENATEVETETVSGNVVETENAGKGMGIASLVLGIISLVLFCVWYISIPCAVVGIILGVLQNKKNKIGMATAGIVCSIIALVLLVIAVIIGFVFGATLGAVGVTELLNEL